MNQDYERPNVPEKGAKTEDAYYEYLEIDAPYLGGYLNPVPNCPHPYEGTHL